MSTCQNLELANEDAGTHDLVKLYNAKTKLQAAQQMPRLILIGREKAIVQIVLDFRFTEQTEVHNVISYPAP